MSRRDTLVGASVAGATAAVVWVVVGTISGAHRSYAGRSAFVLPITGGATSLLRQDVGAWLAGVATVAVVAAALTIPVARLRTGGWPVVVLGGCLAATVASCAAALVIPLVAYGSVVLDLGADGVLTVFATGAYWGVTWGWTVGLAVVLVQRRALRAHEPVTADAASIAAGAVAVLSGLVWLAVGTLRSWADGRTASIGTDGPTAAARLAATLLPVPPGWPVTTLTEGIPRLPGGAVAIAVVAGVLTLVAGRAMDRRHGRTAFVLAVWFATIAGSVVATAVMYVGVDLGDTSPAAPHLLQVVQGGAQLGLQYGWVLALVASLLLSATDRRATASVEELSEAPTAS